MEAVDTLIIRYWSLRAATPLEEVTADIHEFVELTYASRKDILMHMRTTLNIDSALIKEAAKLTGISEKTSLVRMGLEALISRESARRLADLGGTEKQLRQIPRRRSGKLA